jgi:hypothetical protein
MLLIAALSTIFGALIVVVNLRFPTSRGPGPSIWYGILFVVVGVAFSLVGTAALECGLAAT